MLALLDPENHRNFREKGLALAKVSPRVEPQDPLARTRAIQLAEDVFEGINGDFARGGGRAVWEPDLDAPVVVGLGLEDSGGTRVVPVVVRGGGGSDEVGGEQLKFHADALGGLAHGGVEDVAGYAIFFHRGRHLEGVIFGVVWGNIKSQW